MHRPSCDTATAKRSTVSQRGGPAKAVRDYDVPNLHNGSWGAVTCHYLGMGIRGHENTADYLSLWSGRERERERERERGRERERE